MAVVSKNYRLVLNSEAIELGKECFREVFTDMTAKGMTVFNIIMPKNSAPIIINRQDILMKSKIKKKTEWTVFLEAVTIIADMTAIIENI